MTPGLNLAGILLWHFAGYFDNPMSPGMAEPDPAHSYWTPSEGDHNPIVWFSNHRNR